MYIDKYVRTCTYLLHTYIPTVRPLSVNFVIRWCGVGTLLITYELGIPGKGDVVEYLFRYR